MSVTTSYVQPVKVKGDYALRNSVMDAVRDQLLARGECPLDLAMISVAAEIEVAMEKLVFPE